MKPNKEGHFHASLSAKCGGMGVCEEALCGAGGAGDDKTFATEQVRVSDGGGEKEGRGYGV